MQIATLINIKIPENRRIQNLPLISQIAETLSIAPGLSGLHCFQNAVQMAGLK